MSRYRCVDAQKAASFPVVAGCRAAGVSTSAYYAWATRPSPSNPAQPRLVARSAIHTDSHGTYGSPRVTAELRRRGWRAS